MKILTLSLALCLTLAGLLLLGAADNADARIGGGRSFGSRPMFSRPAPRPSPMQSYGTQRTTTPGNAMGTGMRRPGFGGLFGGLLMGGLIGSLFFGGPFMGINLFDFILIGLGIFLLMRLLRGRRYRGPTAPGAREDEPYDVQPEQRGWSQDREDPSRSTPGSGSGHDAEATDPRHASDAYRRAEAAWEAVRTRPAREPRTAGPSAGSAAAPGAGPSISVPEGFDADEFLEGAKMCFTRLQESWAERDLEDIRQFATEPVLAEIESQMRQDPNPASVEVLTLNARLMEVTQEGQETRAAVYYDVLLRETSNPQGPEDVREVWHFVRDEAEQDPSWRLDGIQQVQ
jgi:predicted lipid-binding transport protein (Tim44 family)